MIPNSEPVFFQSTINVIAIKRLGQESGGKKNVEWNHTEQKFLEHLLFANHFRCRYWKNA